MAYKKQNFIDNETVLKASHLNHIEEGLSDLEERLDKFLETIVIEKVRTARIGEITLRAGSWIGDESPYYQVVTLEGVTENTQVDLTPDAEQLSIFHQKDIAFVTENDGGTVTVYAIGQKPMNDYTIQVTMTEVVV